MFSSLFLKPHLGTGDEAPEAAWCRGKGRTDAGRDMGQGVEFISGHRVLLLCTPESAKCDIHAMDGFSTSTSSKPGVDYLYLCSMLMSYPGVLPAFPFVGAPNRFFAKALSFATKLASNKMHVIILDASLPPVITFDPTRVKQVTEEPRVVVGAREGYVASFDFSSFVLSRETFGDLKADILSWEDTHTFVPVQQQNIRPRADSKLVIVETLFQSLPKTMVQKRRR